MKLTQFCKNNVPALGIWTDRGIVDPAVEAAAGVCPLLPPCWRPSGAVRRP